MMLMIIWFLRIYINFLVFIYLRIHMSTIFMSFPLLVLFLWTLPMPENLECVILSLLFLHAYTRVYIIYYIHLLFERVFTTDYMELDNLSRSSSLEKWILLLAATDCLYFFICMWDLVKFPSPFLQIK